MRIISIFVGFMLLLCATAFSQEDFYYDNIVTWKNFDIKTPVRVMVRKFTDKDGKYDYKYHFDSLGRLTKMFKNKKLVDRIEYNKWGYISARRFLKDDSLSFIFDEKGRIVEFLKMTPSYLKFIKYRYTDSSVIADAGESSLWARGWEKVYDNNKQLIAEYEFGSEWQVSSYKKYKRDAAGRIISTIECEDPSAGYLTTSIYSYDQSGNLTKQATTDHGKHLLYSEDNVYNSRNLKIGSTIISNTGPDYQKTTTYVYNSKNSLVEVLENYCGKNSGDTVLTTTRYSENGKLLSETKAIRLVIISQKINEYDHTGKLLTATESDKNGELKTVYKYNKEGNMIRETTTVNGKQMEDITCLYPETFKK